MGRYPGRERCHVATPAPQRCRGVVAVSSSRYELHRSRPPHNCSSPLSALSSPTVSSTGLFQGFIASYSFLNCPSSRRHHRSLLRRSTPSKDIKPKSIYWHDLPKIRISSKRHSMLPQSRRYARNGLTRANLTPARCSQYVDANVAEAGCVNDMDKPFIAAMWLKEDNPLDFDNLCMARVVEWITSPRPPGGSCLEVDNRKTTRRGPSVEVGSDRRT